MAQQGMLTSSGGFKPFDYAQYLRGLEEMYPWLYGVDTAKDIANAELGDIDFSSDYETPTSGPQSASEQVENAYNYYGLNDNPTFSGQNALEFAGAFPGMGLPTKVAGMAMDYSAGINPNIEASGMLGSFIGSKLAPGFEGVTSQREAMRVAARGAATTMAGGRLGEMAGGYLTSKDAGDWYMPTYDVDKYSGWKGPGSVTALAEMGREFPDMVKGTNEYSMMFDELVDEYTGGFAENKGLTDDYQRFQDQNRLTEGYDWQGNAIENFTPYDEVADDIGMLSPYAGRLRTTDVPREGEREIWLEEENRNIWSERYGDKFDRKKNPMVATPLTYQQAMEAANGPDPYGKDYKAFGQEGDDTSRTESGDVFHGGGYNWNSTDGGASDVGGGTDFSPSNSDEDTGP